MKNCYFIGMPGCGKSTFAKQCAKKLNMEWIDLDEAIEKNACRSIPEIFKNSGEEVFRKLEALALNEISKKDGCVISTGAGAVLKTENIGAMKNSGVLIFIDTPLELLIERNEIKGRPLLKGGPAAIEELYLKRQHIYKAVCDYSVYNDSSAETTVLKLCELIQKII